MASLERFTSCMDYEKELPADIQTGWQAWFHEGEAQSGDDYTRITLYPKKKVSEMTREDRIAVCYQYACLLYEEGQAINNQMVRERFNLNKNQTVMASRILADALESGFIKMKDPETESKRYTSYIPYYG